MNANRPWVTERFDGPDPHETPSDLSQAAGDPSLRLGDTNRKDTIHV